MCALRANEYYPKIYLLNVTHHRHHHRLRRCRRRRLCLQLQFDTYINSFTLAVIISHEYGEPEHSRVSKMFESSYMFGSTQIKCISIRYPLPSSSARGARTFWFSAVAERYWFLCSCLLCALFTTNIIHYTSYCWDVQCGLFFFLSTHFSYTDCV